MEISAISPWSGSVTLPDPAEFTGAMANTWRRVLKQEFVPSAKLSRRELYGFAALEFINEHGEEGCAWEVDGLELSAARGWANHYHKAPVRLLSWLGREFEAYIAQVFDPND